MACLAPFCELGALESARLEPSQTSFLQAQEWSMPCPISSLMNGRSSKVIRRTTLVGSQVTVPRTPRLRARPFWLGALGVAASEQCRCSQAVHGSSAPTSRPTSDPDPQHRHIRCLHSVCPAPENREAFFWRFESTRVWMEVLLFTFV